MSSADAANGRDTNSAIDSLIRLLTDSLLLSKDHRPGLFISLCLGSPAQTKRTLYVLLDNLASRYLDRIPQEAASSNSIVVAASGILKSVIEADESRTQEVVKWCTSASGAGLGHGVTIRRAVLAALAQDKDAVITVLEKSLAQFGDELYIRHAALMQQHGKSLRVQLQQARPLTVPSACGSPSTQRRLRTSSLAYQADHAVTIPDLPEHPFKSHCGASSQSSLPGHGSWRSSIGIGRWEGQEVGLQDGGDGQ